MLNDAGLAEKYVREACEYSQEVARTGVEYRMVRSKPATDEDLEALLALANQVKDAILRARLVQAIQGYIVPEREKVFAQFVKPTPDRSKWVTKSKKSKDGETIKSARDIIFEQKFMAEPKDE